GREGDRLHRRHQGEARRLSHPLVLVARVIIRLMGARCSRGSSRNSSRPLLGQIPAPVGGPVERGHRSRAHIPIHGSAVLRRTAIIHPEECTVLLDPLSCASTTKGTTGIEGNVGLAVGARTAPTVMENPVTGNAHCGSPFQSPGRNKPL